VEVGFLSPRSGSRFWHNIESRVETMHRGTGSFNPDEAGARVPTTGVRLKDR